MTAQTPGCGSNSEARKRGGADAANHAAEQTRTDAARAEVKVAVEGWFTDVSLDDLFDVKGWRR